MVTTQILISLSYSHSSMSCIEPNRNRRATNWKNGSAGRNNLGEHLRAGILRDWRFAPGVESGHASYLQICDARKLNRRPLHLLSSSLPNLKLTTAALMKR
jgi:hypothetical protein